MTVAVSGESITFNDSSVQTTAATGFGFKNRIINGAMVVSQRNAGASVTANDGTFSVDRWKYVATANGKFSMQQNAGSVTAPVGFNNYLGATSSSAYAVLTGDFFCIGQQIEGFNFADMAWGTANAKTVALSFQVYSSLTGTFGGTLTNSAGNRSYPFSYSIPAANTWTSISVTVAGDTTGTWVGATNGTAVQIRFGLGAGASYSGTANAWAGTYYNQPTGTVSVVGTSGATFYITGVQLEKGSTATSFDYRPYGTELALCQRYCYMFQNPTGASGDGSTFGAGYTDSSSQGVYFITFPVSMRTTPSLTTVSTASGIEQAYYNGTVTTHNPTSISLISNVSSPNGALMLVGGASFSNGTGAFLRYATQSITPCVFVSAEL